MAATSISAVRVATGLTEPVFATAPSADIDRLFVVERAGSIKILDLASGDTSLFLDISDDVSTVGEGGLLGLAFDPDYAVNGYFYVYLTNASDDTEVRRYQVSSVDPDQADPASETLIIAVDQPDGLTNHKAGWIGFGPADDQLYIALGDGGDDTNAQDAGSLLGKIIRIDVRGDDFPGDAERNYSIPADNPFLATAGARPEIWALGLRNPFRAGFDRTSGDLYIGDVGAGSYEEIDLGKAGANYGWSVYEGPEPFKPAPLGPGTATDPIHFYDRSVGQTVIGGYVYRGPDPDLQGLYFYADFSAGKIFALEKGDTAWTATDLTGQIAPDFGSIANPTSFAEDASGNLYVLDFDGDVYRLGSGAVPCFCRGTPISTERGLVPVEHLAIGDAVLTASGRSRPVKWIGRRAYDPRFVRGNRAILPICIEAGALADGAPRRDLWLSPEHALYLDGALVPARLLLNGGTIRQAATVDRLEYFNIELASHDVILADGAAAETYVDCDNRAMFQNAGEFATVYPDDVPAPRQFCAPRLEAGSAELAAIRARLLRRAEALGRLTSDHGLHLLADGRVVRPHAIADGRIYRFALGSGARSVTLASRSAVPAEAACCSADRRRLGVAIERIVIRGGGRLIEAEHGCSALTEGFHDDEGSHRWTDGHARLPEELLTASAGACTIEVDLAETTLLYPLDQAVNGNRPPARTHGRKTPATPQQRRRRAHRR